MKITVSIFNNNSKKLIKLYNMIQVFTVYICLLYLEKNGKYTKRYRDKLKMVSIELDSLVSSKEDPLLTILMGNKEIQNESLDLNFAKYISFT